jgi:hypothetical protein
MGNEDTSLVISLRQQDITDSSVDRCYRDILSRLDAIKVKLEIISSNCKRITNTYGNKRSTAPSTI